MRFGDYFPRAPSSLSLNLLASTLAMKDPPTIRDCAASHHDA